MRKLAVIFGIAATALVGALIALIIEQQKKIDLLSSQVPSTTPTFAFREKSPPPKGFQARAIESKGLAEFAPENDTISNDSSQVKELAKEMTPIFDKMGGQADKARNNDAIAEIGKIIKKYPSYPDAYFLRASLSVLVGNGDYRRILSDIDNSIKFHSSNSSDSAYSSTSHMYGLRAKIGILSNNYSQTVSDLQKAVEIAVRTSGSADDVFNTGGVKAEDEPDPTALSKRDLDSLVAKYPNDYRTYMFRGLFYTFFTTFDEKYYPQAVGDLEEAHKLNSSSALVEYLLGSVYDKSGFFTKAAWRDISDSGGFKDKANSLALQHFEAATKLDPAFGKAYEQVAHSLSSLKRYSEAIPYYDKVIELEPDNDGGYNDRGMAKMNTGDYYSAINDFGKAIAVRRSKPNGSTNDSSTAMYNSLSYENRAAAYVKVMDYDSAIKDYSSAIGLKIGATVILMSIPEMRAIYPEFSDISDQDFVEGLRQKYFPKISKVEFYNHLQEHKKPYGNFLLADLYRSRGDTYSNAGDRKKAATDYTRARAITGQNSQGDDSPP